MTDVLVAIPTWFAPPTLRPLVATLGRDPRVAHVLVMTNNPDRDAGLLGQMCEEELDMGTVGWTVATCYPPSCPDRTLYQMWNDSAAAAQAMGDAEPHLALLNDDIEITRRTISALAAVLDAHEELSVVSVDRAFDIAHLPENIPPTVEQVSGSRRQGGMPGWCFMVRAGHWIDVDPRYRIWFGDDDLIWKQREAGHHLGIATGVTVRHEVSTTVNAVPWAPEAIASDSALWAETGRP